MAIKIIGAGFPRTGTTTLKNALETLGFMETYHFKDLFANPEKVKYWQQLEKTGQTDFDTLFEGYQASVDFPGYPYYKILMKKYPEAKVILTKRDFEAWYLSTHKTIYQVKPRTVVNKIGRMLNYCVDRKFRNKIRCINFVQQRYIGKQFDGKFTSKAEAEKVFFQHLKEVESFVPKEKLLVFDVREGWEPLCRFLDVPIPAEAFPHLNKKEQFPTMLNIMIDGMPKQAKA